MSSSAIALARTWISRLAAKKNFDSLLMTVEPVGGEIGNIVFEMKVEPKHANAFDTLHGGAAAYLVDALSSVSQLTLDRPPGKEEEPINSFNSSKYLTGQIFRTIKSFPVLTCHPLYSGPPKPINDFTF